MVKDQAVMLPAAMLPIVPSVVRVPDRVLVPLLKAPRSYVIGTARAAEHMARSSSDDRTLTFRLIVVFPRLYCWLPFRSSVIYARVSSLHQTQVNHNGELLGIWLTAASGR